jgi:regulator of nucleoside diphosphate kinase
MTPRPAIIITREDQERLLALLENPAAFGGPEGRTLHDLEEELDRAEIVEPERTPPDVVTMNSSLRIRDLDTGEERVCRIVFPSQKRSSEEDISILAPLGVALLGNRCGNVVEWRVPKGLRRLKIIEILHQPEAARMARA